MWRGQTCVKLLCWAFKILKMPHNLSTCHIYIPVLHNYFTCYFTYLSALVNLLPQLPPYLNQLQKSERLFY